MSLRDNYVTFDGEMDSQALADSYAPGRTVRTEFSTLLGLLIRQPIDLTEPTPAQIQALFDRTRTLLEELHARLGRPMWDSIRNRQGGTTRADRTAAFAVHPRGRAQGTDLLWQRINSAIARAL
ncbi:hypothetical protein [Sphingomonas oligophenolica]